MTDYSKADLSDAAVAARLRGALKELRTAAQLAASVGLKVRWKVLENEVGGNLTQSNRQVRFDMPHITEINRPVQ